MNKKNKNVTKKFNKMKFNKEFTKNLVIKQLQLFFCKCIPEFGKKISMTTLRRVTILTSVEKFIKFYRIQKIINDVFTEQNISMFYLIKHIEKSFRQVIRTLMKVQIFTKLGMVTTIRFVLDRRNVPSKPGLRNRQQIIAMEGLSHPVFHNIKRY